MDPSPPSQALALRLLEAVRERLGSPEYWTRLACARDELGVPTHEQDPSATRWSLYGAIYLESARLLHEPIQHAERHAAVAALEHALGDDYVLWHDAPGRTHADVLALFDKARAKLEQTP